MAGVARGRGQPSSHQGRWRIGTLEKYQGRRGERPGAVQGGNIRKIRAGRIKFKGVVKYEDLILFKRETEAMDLPGTLKA